MYKIHNAYNSTAGTGARERRISQTVSLAAPADCVRHVGVAPSTVLAERFVVEAWIGRGGMGEVYRGRDLKTGVPVVIKLIASLDPADGALC